MRLQLRLRPKTLFWSILAVFLALGLAGLGSRLLWGYWFSRPTMAPLLEEADEILGISVLSFNPAGLPVISAAPNAGLSRAKRFCERISNECLEGRLLLSLERKRVTVGGMPRIDESKLLTSWRSAFPRESAWRPLLPAQPIAGLAVQFREGRQEYILLSYRTSEISDDRYLYGETLIRVGDSLVEPVRRLSFFFEIAGLEAITWRFLFVTILLLGLIPLGGGLVAQKKDSQ